MFLVSSYHTLSFPHGANNILGTVQRRVGRSLTNAGFPRNHTSGYWRHGANAAETWQTLLALRMVEPPGVVQTCVKTLKIIINYGPRLQVVYDVMEEFRLVGDFPPTYWAQRPQALSRRTSRLTPLEMVKKQVGDSNNTEAASASDTHVPAELHGRG